MSEEEFNGMKHAEELLERCRRTLRMWRGVYKSLGVEFQWREPTAEQMQQAIRIEAERYKDNK
jgi:DNA/RNA-binding domain of Phe-tRNA-synthetase-like protein